MNKVSVIMPTYNSEKTIEKSIRSVLKQTYKNFELIIVNDGSTDNTENIIKNLKLTDDRIIYIKTVNQGVSSARNTALESASGDYITFIDSDDFYNKSMLEILVSYLLKYDCDLVSCSYKRVNSTNIVPEETYYEEGLYDKGSLVTKIYPSIIADKTLSNNVPLNIWTKIFKKNLIDYYNIRFNEDINLGEDLLFSKEYFLHSESFYYSPHEKLYEYANNQDSVTNTFFKNREEKLRLSLNSQNSLCKKFPEFDLANQLPYYQIRIALASMANIIRYMDGTKEQIIDEICIIVENKIVIEACKKVSPKSFDFSRRIIYECIMREKINLLYLITKIYKII